MLDTWLYDDDKVFDTLALNDTYKSLRDKINTGYFEKLIEKYFLDNTHASFVVMKPVMGLTEARDKKTALKLEEYKKSLSKDEIERIVKETAELKKYQSEPSTEEELAKIPLYQEKIFQKTLFLFTMMKRSKRCQSNSPQYIYKRHFIQHTCF